MSIVLWVRHSRDRAIDERFLWEVVQHVEAAGLGLCHSVDGRGPWLDVADGQVPPRGARSLVLCDAPGSEQALLGISEARDSSSWLHLGPETTALVIDVERSTRRPDAYGQTPTRIQQGWGAVEHSSRTPPWHTPLAPASHDPGDSYGQAGPPSGDQGGEQGPSKKPCQQPAAVHS